MDIITADYGSWKSPITAEAIVSKSIKLGNVRVDGIDIYWDEGRSFEKGKTQIVKYMIRNENINDVLPKEYNARTKVHEYGGCAFAVKNNDMYFSNYSDQRIYNVNKEGAITPITPVLENMRYADIEIDEKRKCIYCVVEEQTGDKVDNYIIAIDLKSEDKKVSVIASGNDFYSSPKISPDGKHLCYFTWNHPDMPWDNTELILLTLDDDGTIINTKKITGTGNESVCQPKWSADNILYFISDMKSGWWNIYRYNNGEIEEIYKIEEEFGYPDWLFGFSTYDIIGENNDYIACTSFDKSIGYLNLIDIKAKKMERIKGIKFSTFMSIKKYSDESVVFIAGSSRNNLSVVLFNMFDKTSKILKESSDIKIDDKYISEAKLIEFPTENELTSYAFYYPPKNDDFKASSTEKPPLIVQSHGGPTACSTNELNLKIQYWTSRGYAFCDVNYGGSTGFGRKYRERLFCNWGVVDVLDCINAAKYLSENNMVDKNRLIIRGGSAGGYTTLAALSFYDTFNAGASYYGVSDVEAMANLGTHKFESRYLDKLIGKYPQEIEKYKKLSPINNINGFDCPIILFQGGEDKVVPPVQSEKVYYELKDKDILTAYVLFENEGHGFRIAENIKRSLENELYFYSQTFGIPIDEEIESVQIENISS
jgi:dipeptidyl aminopeptidase/acylaminoacyl peptidase